MSDGGRDKEQVEHHRHGVILRKSRQGNGNGNDEYGRAIAKIAVVQICESLGFGSIQNSALDNLADVVIRYLGDLGKAAHFYANLAGRTDCNVFDIVQVLEDLGVGGGGGLGRVGEIEEYVREAEEVPFAQPVPSFPVVRARGMTMTPSFLQIGEVPEGRHIPEWLPAFPDPHTYVSTPMWNERRSDPRADKIEQARQRRKAERSLLSLQQRLACNGMVEEGFLGVGIGKEKQVAEGSGKEKEGSLVTVRSLKGGVVERRDRRSSVLETFAPVIEAGKSGMNGNEDCERKDVRKKRPVVHFKFGSSKKSLGLPLDLTLQNNGVRKPAIMLGREDEKDDKKRRAHQILRESMENPEELTQL